MNFLLIRSNSSLKFDAIFFAPFNSVLIMFFLYLFGILDSQETGSFVIVLYILI